MPLDPAPESMCWLPPAPVDFGRGLREALDNPSEAGARPRAPTAFPLDENQLNRLANAIDKARRTGCSMAR